MDCTFCKIYSTGAGIIYENEHFFAQFDRFPVAPGHAEVIPKRHVASLFDLTKDEWSGMQHALSDVVRQIEQTDLRALYQGFVANPLNDKSVEFCKKMLNHVGIGKKPDAYNIGVNEGEAAGRTIHHLHIHLIPRFFGDVEDYVGGVRHIIPGMGNYKKIVALPSPILKTVPSLLAPFSRTTPCRLSAIASGLITTLIWNFPGTPQILSLFDKI